jgi:hypothetical protein
VHARSSYKPDEIVFGRKFASIYNPVLDDGTISIDVSRLSETEEAPLEDDDEHVHPDLPHTGHFTGFAPPRPPTKPREGKR